MEVNPDVWYEKLGEIARDSLVESDCHILVERVGYPLPAWESEKNTELVRAFLSGIRSEGGAPRFVYKTGTADLNVVAPVWRCPIVVYGPGDSALDHTPNENISIEEYARAVKVVKETLQKLTKL